MSQPEDPLDVNLNKIHDWLSQRNKLDPKWRHELHAVKEKIQVALENLPDEPELAELRKATDIDFYHCQEIRRILSASGEHGKKNFFGRYTSKFMKDWDEIIAKFQKGNIYIGDIAASLNRTVTYEIPHRKKVIEKSQSQISELMRKEKDFTLASREYLAKYTKSCSEFGIEGKSVRVELRERCKKLPEIFRDVIGKIQSAKMEEALSYYSEFISYTLGPKHTRRLANIAEVRGQTDWTFEIGQLESSSAGPASNEAGGDIDWGGDAPAADIDWGAEAAPVATGAAAAAAAGGDDIDWGIEETPAKSDGADIDWGDDGGVVAAGGDDGIDWGDGGDVAVSVESGSAGVASATAGKRNIFEDLKGRNALLDDLYELQGFLKQRALEMATQETNIMGDLMSDAPGVVQRQGADTVEKMEREINDILHLLNSPVTQQLILISTSAPILERLVRSLEQKVESSEKMLKSVTQCAATRKDVAVVIESTHAELADLIANTKKTKKTLEEALTAEFKGRQVNIIGEINTI